MNSESSSPVPPPDGGGQPDFAIVGVGASAGGLEALTALVKALTIDRMAVVVVQHMSPQHESMLPELLGRVSQATVVDIVDGTRIEPNHIYVAPGNTQLSLLRGVVQVMAPETRHPIDFFFRALAEDHGRDAIGVVLSGMGSDGTLGLRAIREHGGIPFVQSPPPPRSHPMPPHA